MATDNPKLWSIISVSLGLRWVQFALSKVKGHRFTLEIDGSKLYQVPLTTFHGHRDQIVTLALTSFSQQNWDHLLTASFPNLKEIRFFERNISAWSLLNAAWSDTFASTTEIIFLDLCTVYMASEDISRFENLRSLSLSTYPMEAEDARDYLRTTLPLLPALEALRITTAMSGLGTSTRIKLETLVRLHVSGSDLDIVNFLQNFEFPQAREVEVVVPGGWDIESLSDEERLCREMEPYLAHSDRTIERLEISWRARGSSAVKMVSTSGPHRFTMRVPVPSSSIITHTSNLLDLFDVRGCDHLVLSAATPSTAHEEDEDWDQLLGRTTGLTKLSLSGYGDRWRQLSTFIGERRACGKGKSWQSLAKVEMRKGFWVRMEAARSWLEALARRARKKNRLSELSVSQWEMQESGRYQQKFQNVVNHLVWEVSNPGRTEYSTCIHVRSDSGGCLLF